MKQGHIYHIFQLALCVGLCVALTACFQDETSDGTNPISEITIVEGSIQSEYNIEKNEHLVIQPQFTQTNGDKPLTYTWEVDQKAVSTSASFDYECKTLGTFNCRLVVENEDGKAFFPFVLNVNSPYEEGITLISRDVAGKSMLSFMLRQPDSTVPDFFVEGDCFAANNSDYSFAGNVIDMVQCDGSIILTCQGDASTPPTIYYLNEKTFEVENVITVPEYADFKPYRMLMPHYGAVGADYPILCENGRVYQFSSREAAISESPEFKSTYALSSILYDSGTMSFNNIIFWDKDRGALCLLYNGYGPFYCSKTYLQPAEGLTPSTNYMSGYNFVFMFLPKAVGKISPYADNIMVITKNAITYQKLTLSTGFWQYNELTGNNDLADYGGMKMAGFSCDLTETTPHVASDFFKALYYGKGNVLKRWQYTFDNKYLNQADALATVGSAQAVISALDLSEDHQELYVAYYEPGETGLCGHLAILETETGKLLRQYDNIAYRPVKVFYKKK